MPDKIPGAYWPLSRRLCRSKVTPEVHEEESLLPELADLTQLFNYFNEILRLPRRNVGIAQDGRAYMTHAHICKMRTKNFNLLLLLSLENIKNCLKIKVKTILVKMTETKKEKG